MRHDETLDESKGARSRAAGPPLPGLVLVFSANSPMISALPFDAGVVEIGRDTDALASLRDPLLSRQHARVERLNGRFIVRDVGSRNGTAVDGERLSGAAALVPGQVVRTGATLFFLCADVSPYLRGVQVTADAVIGPMLRETYDAIARAARHSRTLHVSGETGAGKEHAARVFHASGPVSRGPFVAVNCAAIPEGVAERLLFGAKKGAYSGASSDTAGYLQTADGGTLFLDEVGDLQREVQAKLLRVLETQEVLALGAPHPQRIDVRFCTATHRDLRLEIAAGRMREDFYFRIGRPEVAVPPLRARLEEIPWLLHREVRRMDARLELSASLVEACLLRPWPGNVRELLSEARAAALEALDGGSQEVTSAHLSRIAGLPLTRAQSAAPASQSPAVEPRPAPDRDVERTSPAAERRPRRHVPPGKEELAALMERHGGVLQDVAAAIGCSRRQVGRWLDALDETELRRSR